MGCVTNNLFQQSFVRNLKYFVHNRCIEFVASRKISTNKFLLAEKPPKLKPSQIFHDKDGKMVKKRVDTSPKVLVRMVDGSKEFLHLNQIKKIAERNNLEIEETTLPASKNKTTYSLVTGSSFRKEKNKGDEKKKLLRIKSKILDNDLTTKINYCKKLLEKGNKVIIEITKSTSESNNELDKIFNKIKDQIGSEFKIASKSEFGLGLKIQICQNENKGGNTVGNEDANVKSSQ